LEALLPPGSSSRHPSWEPQLYGHGPRLIKLFAFEFNQQRDKAAPNFYLSFSNTYILFQKQEFEARQGGRMFEQTNLLYSLTFCSTINTRGRFNQHFMRAFYLQKYFAQLFTVTFWLCNMLAKKYWRKKLA
jgi:hypothetical protein